MFNSAALVSDYINSGKSVLTAKSLVTNKHFTFKFNRAKTGNTIFISVLSAQNQFKYIGLLNKDSVHLTQKSKYVSDDSEVIAVDYVLRSVYKGKIPNVLSLQHDGKCGRCRRRLTHPESLNSGIGPECIKKI